MKVKWKRISAAVMALVMVATLIQPTAVTVLAAEEKAAEYEIYPSPQQMEYQDSSWNLDEKANIVAEAGIDEATKDRMYEVLDLKEIIAAESRGKKEGMMNVLVGIHGSGGYVDQYVSDNYEVPDSLFAKTDAYFLASSENTLVVLGADTDAAFYGLTSLYHIFNQVEDKAIRCFEMQDWADVVSRGFIEGYYGNPWSTENRIDLMTWGGYYKLNSYFYAPKDDPKHNSNWKGLYTDEEIEEKIKPLAEAGNASKCRFVYALHPYMYNAIRYTSEEAYQEDLAALQAKFTQVIKAGVRQIAILADDAANVGSANYIKTLNDMTAWLQEMRKEYPDLKMKLPFCTVEYMSNGESYYSQFPENVQIVMTGGRIWGEVTNEFTTTFTTNTGRGPYLWINWPCTDNSKKHLIMGGYSTFLHPGVDPAKIQGIVLNPMQQSEPSKVAIFGNACYSWNIWDTEEEADLAWEASFKYVDHNSAAETDASAALREISRHMINQAMDTRVTALQESLNIKEELTEIKANLEAGSVTKEACDSAIEIFEKLQAYAHTFRRNPGDTKLRDQMIYWLNCWEDTTTAAIAYLEGVKAELDNDTNTLLQKYNEGKVAFDKSKTYGFHYVDHTEYAEVGVQHIVPFINALGDYVLEKVQYIMDPDAIQQKFITNRTDNPAVGSKESVFDGNDSTYVSYQNPNALYKDDYVGVMMNKVIPIHYIRFLLGTGQNHIEHAQLQYTLDGKTWTKLNDTDYAATYGEYQEVIVEEEGLPDDFEAMGLRLIATQDNARPLWLEVFEITVNEKQQSSGEDEQNRITGTVELVSMSNQSGTTDNLFDGNGSTELWLAKAPYEDPNRDAVPEGAVIKITFAEPKQLGTLKLVQGTSAAADVYTSAEVQYTTDGTTWNKAGTIGTEAEQTVDFGGVEGVTAVRIVNSVMTKGWLRIGEIDIREGGAKPADDTYLYTNIETEVLSEEKQNVTSLTAGTVSLSKDDYIGIRLNNIRTIENIDVGTLPAGLKLQTSKNEVVWEDYTASAAVDARYIRVVNTTDASVSWKMDVFAAEYFVIGDYAVESDLGTQQSSSDMRVLGTVGNVFDGDLSTGGMITGVQEAGKSVLFDLGRPIDFKSLRYYIVETQLNYPRDVVFEVANDPEAEEWTPVLTVKKEGFTNALDQTTAKDMQDKGLTHDSQNPGYMYAKAENLDVTGRYLRVRVVSDYGYRWLYFNEIVINGGEYVSGESLRDVVSEAVEERGMLPSYMLDGNINTSYQSSAEDSSFTYYISEPENVKAISIIQFGELSDAVITAELYDTATGKTESAEFGTLSWILNSVNIPEGKIPLAVKVAWKDVRPEIAEIKLMSEAVDEPEPSTAGLQEKVDKYNKLSAGDYTAQTWKEFTAALEAAEAVLKDTKATQLQVNAALRYLNAAKDALVESSVEAPAVSKSILEKFIKDCKESGLVQADYTEDSWQAYQESLDAAETVVSAADATQEAVDGALKALRTTRAALRGINELPDVDKTALKELIQKYEGENLKQEDYEEDSWAAYTQALKDAKDVLAKEDAVQEDVTKAYDALKAAYDGLVKADTPIKLPFEDVLDQPGYWYYDTVADVYRRGLMTGKSEKVFAPLENLARAQFAVILWRMEGEPAMTYEAKFPDVPDGQFYTQAVLWAAENGIVTGYTSTNTFGPSDNITREQMAVMMYRYANYKKYDVTKSQELDSFPDAGQVQPFATEAVKWCTAMEIITGDGGKLNPQGNTNRAVCATIISRFVRAYEE